MQPSAESMLAEELALEHDDVDLKQGMAHVQKGRFVRRTQCRCIQRRAQCCTATRGGAMLTSIRRAVAISVCPSAAEAYSIYGVLITRDP
jgi:hypothetical protein